VVRLGVWLDRRGPAVATGFAGAAVVATITTLTLLWWGARRGVMSNGGIASDLVVGITYPVVAALILRRQPRNAAGWVMLSAALVSVAALSQQWLIVSTSPDGKSLPLALLFAWLASWTFFPYWLQFTLLPLLFPSGALPSPRWRWPVRLILALTAVGATGGAFLYWEPHPDIPVTNPAGIEELRSVFSVMLVVGGFGSMFVGIPLGLAGLFLRRRRAVGRERAQVHWLLFGFIVGVALALPSTFHLGPQVLWLPLFALGFACVPAAITVAMIRHRLFDIELVVSRTIIYAVLIGVSLVAYVAIVGTISLVLGGTPSGPFVAAAVALGAAAWRRRLQQAVDRRMFGHRADPYIVVRRIGADLEATTPAEAVRRLVDTVRETLRVPYVAVESVIEGVPCASTGTPQDELEALPIVVAGRTLATFQVGRRRGERFSPDETDALTTVALQAGSLLQNAALVADLQRSREQLVAAREEERRLLRRELHDGVSPALAGMALQLDSLAERLGDDAELATRASRLRSDMTTTVAEIRRVIDGLRPVVLDELGLAESLRGLPCAVGARIGMEIDGDLAHLPPATTVAAYRIAAEALINAVRHSGADSVCLTARVEGPDLRIEVRDDGAGFDADVVPGVGLQSMHERAAEVGGSLDVRSRPGRGTWVRAMLPAGER
jgi:signal transduction histidine kinase